MAMLAGSLRRIRPLTDLVLVVLLCVGAPGVVVGCSVFQTNCPAGWQGYKGVCMTNMAVQYVVCTEGKGMDVTTEISGGAGGTFKVVADASLNIAYKRAQTENTPVALEIVKACLEIAKATSPPNDPEQGALLQFQQDTVNSTPQLTISPTTAKEGAQVTLTASKFWPTEMVDVFLHAALVAQVQADATGGFSTTITVPSSAPPPGFPTTITATGQSSAKSAMAPFQTAP